MMGEWKEIKAKKNIKGGGRRGKKGLIDREDIWKKRHLGLRNGLRLVRIIREDEESG